MDYKASTVEKYLSTWFFENDELIVPNFGKFVAHYQTAQINEQIDYFSPPNKEITFSEDVKNDPENRFVAYVAAQENIELEDSQKLIQTYVTNFKFSLSGQKRQNIIGFGTFLFTEEEKIRFQADENNNFLADSYGLPKLVIAKAMGDTRSSPKSLSTTQDEEMDNTQNTYAFDVNTNAPNKEVPKDHIVVEEEDAEEEDDRSSRLVLGIIVIVVIAIVATLAITQFSDDLGLSGTAEEVDKKEEDKKKEKVAKKKEEEREDDKKEEEEDKAKEDKRPEVVPPNPTYNTNTNQSNPSEATVNRNNRTQGIAKNFTWNPAPPSNPSAVNVTSPTQNYYVVLGSFSNQARAYSWYNNLQKYNIQSKIIINGSGGYRVAIGGFSSSSEATRESGKVQAEHGLIAWILKY